MTVPGQPRGETAPAGGAAAFEAQALRRRFDADREQLIGLEEEVMAVDPRTLDLLPRAAALLALPGGEDPRFKLELPASQIEIVTAPHRTVGELVAELTGARRALACAAGGEAAFLAAGVHPFAPAEGELNAGAHYAEVAADYGIVARRQLVCGLHVHIALRGAERTLAVYNAMRAYLPMLAALAANAPVHEGRDTGLASIRPLISGMLPRQGVPPPMASWEELAEELAWGARTGRLQRLRGWWWELRVHAELATLEVRVADAQSSVE